MKVVLFNGVVAAKAFCFEVCISDAESFLYINEYIYLILWTFHNIETRRILYSLSKYVLRVN